MAEKPPNKLDIEDLSELLEWYEENLCAAAIEDPRGHKVKFDPDRFAYLIKLQRAAGGKVNKPRKAVNNIRSGKHCNDDFGGFNRERAETLSWIKPIIERPTLIAENKAMFIPGDELYIKEFDKRGYPYKVLVCRRVSEKLLVPITSFPKTRVKVLDENILWKDE
ncbi:MAG TPA: hypothetical protein VGR50_01155 [Terriglobales bacterium]|nr:hypothetical protein [Terriglobales bacterium]